MKKGDEVKLIQPVIQGRITATAWNEDKDCKEHTVEWAVGDEVHTRAFLETELEAVATPAGQ